jgi:hypothetical protein
MTSEEEEALSSSQSPELGVHEVTLCASDVAMIGLVAVAEEIDVWRV